MIKQITLIFFVIFALIGAMFISTVLHEISHYRDFEQFDMENEEICILGFPAEESGMSKYIPINPHYTYLYSIKDKDKIEKVGEYTELKAYSLQISLLLIFVMGFYFFLDFVLGVDNKRRLKDEN